MPNLTRKRLKKKVLDRWENEGGRLCDAPPTPAQADAASDPKARETGAGARSSNDDTKARRKAPG